MIYDDHGYVGAKMLDPSLWPMEKMNTLKRILGGCPDKFSDISK
jgi:hypothetical protein